MHVLFIRYAYRIWNFIKIQKIKGQINIVKIKLESPLTANCTQKEQMQEKKARKRTDPVV